MRRVETTAFKEQKKVRGIKSGERCVESKLIYLKGFLCVKFLCLLDISLWDISFYLGFDVTCFQAFLGACNGGKKYRDKEREQGLRGKAFGEVALWRRGHSGTIKSKPRHPLICPAPSRCDSSFHFFFFLSIHLINTLGHNLPFAAVWRRC